jgi:hypothetical protein
MIGWKEAGGQAGIFRAAAKDVRGSRDITAFGGWRAFVEAWRRGRPS